MANYLIHTIDTGSIIAENVTDFTTDEHGRSLALSDEGGRVVAVVPYANLSYVTLAKEGTE